MDCLKSLVKKPLWTLLMMSDDPMPSDIDDESYENEDLDDDGLMIG